MKIIVSSPAPCTHCGAKLIVRKTYIPADFSEELEELIYHTKCRPCEKIYNKQCKAFSKVFELEQQLVEAKRQLEETTASYQQRMHPNPTSNETPKLTISIIP
jgi:hypothetical protein